MSDGVFFDPLSGAPLPAALELPEVVVDPSVARPAQGSIAPTYGYGQAPEELPAGVGPQTTSGGPYAVVVIDGEVYWEWESVEVKLSIGGNPPNTFRFTASEQEPYPSRMAFLRILPGDKCTIYLDNQLAITGVVETRQVYYDATSHQVEIQGKGNSGMLDNATADNQTGEYKNQTPEQLISAIAGKGGVPVMLKGFLPNFKIPRFSVTDQNNSTEAIGQVLRMAGAQKMENPDGSLVILGNNFAESTMAQVIEGENILIGRETIHSAQDPGEMMGSAQGHGDDNQSMSDSAQVGTQNSAHQQFSMGQPDRVMSEMPMQNMLLPALRQRLGLERSINQQNEITANITVWGWKKSATGLSGGLWAPGEKVSVYSPMLVLHGEPLILKSVTFTQDNNSGSRSTLELVNETAFSQAEPQ
jgi:prophage tail gpP-like protein